MRVGGDPRGFRLVVKRADEPLDLGAGLFAGTVGEPGQRPVDGLLALVAGRFRSAG